VHHFYLCFSLSPNSKEIYVAEPMQQNVNNINWFLSVVAVAMSSWFCSFAFFLLCPLKFCILLRTIVMDFCQALNTGEGWRKLQLTFELPQLIV